MFTLYTAPRNNLTPAERAAMRRIARRHGGTMHPTTNGVCIAVDTASPDSHRAIERAIERDMSEAGI